MGRSLSKVYGPCASLEEVRDALIADGFPRITTERVRQIEGIALGKLRHRMKAIATILFISDEFAAPSMPNRVKRFHQSAQFEDYRLVAMSYSRDQLLAEIRRVKEERRQSVYRAALRLSRRVK